ncbi:MAG: hypothetical protein MZV63_62570 [Marinilabiliales bacterium]|nr:hypothetical protein [Marinilabiliales bacterium]
MSRGLMPVNVMASDGEGGRTQKRIFPSLTVTMRRDGHTCQFPEEQPITAC